MAKTNFLIQIFFYFCAKIMNFAKKQERMVSIIDFAVIDMFVLNVKVTESAGYCSRLVEK